MKRLMFLLLLLITPCFAQALPANSTLYIYTILLPIMAAAFTLVALLGKKGILPSLFSSTLWFVSSMTTTRIRIIDNYTVSASPYYVDAGNWETGTVFLAFATIMGIYTVIMILDFLYTKTSEGGNE